MCCYGHAGQNLFNNVAAAGKHFAFVLVASSPFLMGDAGSVFLGYIFGSLILVTVMCDVTVWTWLYLDIFFINSDSNYTNHSCKKMVLGPS